MRPRALPRLRTYAIMTGLQSQAYTSTTTGLQEVKEAVLAMLVERFGD